MPNVSHTKKELQAVLSQYQIIDDCVAGEQQVKFRKERYLPKPNAHDLSTANEKRYQAYLLRAVFYNVTRRTLNGLTGQIFDRIPEIKLKPGLAAIEDNANGSGVGLVQLSKKCARGVISKGRGGLHVDYLDTGEFGISRRSMETDRVAPTINYYKANEIINWRVETFGSEDLLTLVVLKEEYTKTDDGFAETVGTQYRVLRLENRQYTVTIYRDSNLNAPATKTIAPTKNDGTFFDRIPFTFVGIDDNDPDVDEPPMYDLATLNLAHYRNSADFEEMAYMIGQPTPWFSGLTEDWVKDVLGGTVYLGSRGAVPLPVGAEAGLLQIDESNILQTAMEHKERQMVALGARLVEQRSVQRTAAEAKLEAGSESSTLSSASNNVSNAFKQALEWACLFTGDDPSGIEFKLNDEFDLAGLEPEELKQVISSWQSETISWTEMRTRLRHSGLATQDDDEAKTEIENDATAHSERMRDQVAADIEAGITTPPNAPPPASE